MNEDLAKKARVEWERRLKAGALNEEDWTDITEKEMEAVEAAFVPAPLSDDPQVDFNAGDDSRYSMDGSTLSGSPPEPTFEFDPKKAFPPSKHTPISSGFSTDPFGFNSNHPFSSSKPNARTQPASAWGANKNTTARDDLQESPWEASMKSKTNDWGARNGHTTPSPPTSNDTESPWDKATKKGHGVPSWDTRKSNGTPIPPAQEESPWERAMKMGTSATPVSRSSSNSSPSSNFDDSESPWERAKKGATNGNSYGGWNEPKPDPSESLWDNAIREGGYSWGAPKESAPPPPPEPDPSESLWTRATGSSASSAAWNARKPPVHPAADPSEGLWGSAPPKGFGHTSKPSISSPLATHVSTVVDNAGYKAISPIIVEEEGDLVEVGFDGLTEEDLDDAVREYHREAAEAEILLRRKLLSAGDDKKRRTILVNDHHRSMEANARAIVDGWKAAQQAHKEKQLAEAKRAAYESTNARRGGFASMSAAATASKIPVPEPPKSKKAAKKAVGKKGNIATVEEVADLGDDVDHPPPVSHMAPPPPLSKKADPPSAFGKSSFAGWGMSSEDREPPPSMMSGWGARASTPSRDLPGRTSSPLSSSTNSNNPYAKPKTPAPPGKSTTSNGWNTSARADATAGSLFGPREHDMESNEEADLEGMASKLFGRGNPGPGSQSQWGWGSSNDDPPVGHRSGTPKPEAVPRSHAMNGVKSAWGASDPSPPPNGKGFSSSSASSDLPASARSPSRFETWKPERREPVKGVARDMVDIAMQNLHETVDENAGAEDMVHAMSMYTKAVSGFERKRAGSTARR